MISRIFRVYKFEFSKVIRWKYMYVSLLLTIVGCGLSSVVPEVLYSQWNANSSGYILFATIANFTCYPVLTLLAVIFSGMLVGQEYTHGMLPAILSYPMKRWEIITGKMLLAFTYNIVFLLVTFIVAFVIALILQGFEPQALDMQRSLSLSTFMPQIFHAFWLTILPLIGVSALEMAITYIVENTGIAIGITIVGGVILSLVRFLSTGIDKISVVEFIGMPTSLLVNVGEYIQVDWMHEVGTLGTVSGVTILVAFLVMLVRFGCRNVV